MTNEERIKADAEAATNDHAVTLRASEMEYAAMIMRLFGYKEGYIAGATAEHERTEDEIDKAIHDERNKMQAKFNESDKQWAGLLREQNVRAQVLVDALNEFISYHETGLLPARHVYEKAVAARQQWKSGKEKEEVTDEGKYQQWIKENVTVLGEFDFLFANKRIYGKKELRRIYDYLTNPRPADKK